MKTTTRSSAGFSLVEIVLALGVFAFAIVAILGLFPAALTTAQRARAESIAPEIARGIFATLRGNAERKYDTFPPSGANASFTGQVKVARPDKSTGLDLVLPLNLANTDTRYVVYTLDGECVGQAANAVNISKLGFFLVTVASTPDPDVKGLTSLTVTIEYPATAQKKDRDRLVFLSRIAK